MVQHRRSAFLYKGLTIKFLVYLWFGLFQLLV